MKKPKKQDEARPAASAEDSEAAAAPDNPDAPGPAGAPTEADAKEDSLEELKAQVAKGQENWDRLLRVTAEFDNFRKRAARDKEEAIRYANHKLLERLLPVMDSFDMAITAASAQNGETSQSLKEGIDLVFQQFKSVLTEAGLEEIESHGKPFDPNLHEAVSQLETEEFEEGHVAHQIRKGYLLRDRLVRPSTVVVAKKPDA
jgi:molecular chaperone GrpE